MFLFHTQIRWKIKIGSASAPLLLTSNQNLFDEKLKNISKMNYSSFLIKISTN